MMICLQCEVEFEEKNYNQKFCSIKCKTKHHGTRHKYVKICEYCGNEFHPHRKTQVFCCRDCSVRGRSGPTKRSSPDTNAQCAYCGRRIYVQPKRLKNQFVYCDSKCMGAHRRIISNGEDNPNFQNVPLKVCEGCGKEFKSYNSTRRYCSALCSYGASKNEAIANQKRGLEAEKMCAKELKRKGYSSFLSAGSRGDFDVIGISEEEMLLIQVKRTKSMQPGRIFPKKAIEKLKNAKYPAGKIVKKQMWTWVDMKEEWHIKGV